MSVKEETTDTKEKVAAIEESSAAEPESEEVPESEDGSGAVMMPEGSATGDEGVSGSVPEEVQREVMAVLNEQIAAYNASQLDRYMNTLSKNAVGFDYEKEKLHMQAAFEQLDSKMELVDHSFDKYDEQGFVTVITLVKADNIVKATGKRVQTVMQNANIFQKEPDGWKMTASLIIE
jgi:ketosteroid isomerase-like protein